MVIQTALPMLAVTQGSAHVPESGHLLFTPPNSTVSTPRDDENPGA